MKIEIDLPEFNGFIYTGEYRQPEHDEYGCRGPGGDQIRNCHPNHDLFILRKVTSAERTLKNLGYTDHGGEYWKPPLGPIPDYIKLEK